MSSFVGNIENIQVAFKSWSQCSMASKLPWIQIKASCIEQSVSIQTSDVDTVKMGCSAGRNRSFAEELVIALWQLLLLLQPVNYSVLSKERGVVL